MSFYTFVFMFMFMSTCEFLCLITFLFMLVLMLTSACLCLCTFFMFMCSDVQGLAGLRCVVLFWAGLGCGMVWSVLAVWSSLVRSRSVLSSRVQSSPVRLLIPDPVESSPGVQSAQF